MEGRDPVVVVLISGSGSNLQALIDAYQREEIPGKISAVISNKPHAKGLERAKKAEIDTHVIEHQKFAQREIFDAELIKTIEKHQPDLVVLAGFMRILTDDFVRRFEGRMLNIHPSLLPKYPGLHTHKRALEAKDKEHGVSVHFVTAELDSGPNIIQAIVPVLNQDTEETLATRVLEKEHIIYPIAVKWFIDGRLEMKDGQAYLDGEQLPESGLKLEIEQR
ncbi:phosphoribosylglycinamide formyltransferase [Oleiphilus sp. HI0132]|uniref:phosphoribosylglycinamide formyltransferase n=1 Tax=Oleiphilus sp. HI0132 TaxID=1822270 RepID=UPI0007C27BBC|nr:phosphoribosylglycinamide formyltransferase [Oleiphilus sp. HI0132]KZZ80745.1 phosphoribosylglycinamide formyltransferase [Oleiphilus sp. HI0132]